MWLVLLSFWALTVQGQVGSGSLQNANWTSCGANSGIEMTFVSTAMTWNAAEQSCQRVQGHLATVTTSNDLQCARQTILPRRNICGTVNCDQIHVGVRSFGDSMRYLWLGQANAQASVENTPWRLGMPGSGLCGFWERGPTNVSFLGAGPCNITERFFLCQRPYMVQAPPPIPEPDVRWPCPGLNRSITYNTISFNLSDARQKCLRQNGMLAGVLGENEACLTDLMMSLGSGAQLEQTRVACGNCPRNADCVTLLPSTMQLTTFFSTIQDARPFFCEIHSDRCQDHRLGCSLVADCPVIMGQAPTCECLPGFTGDGKSCSSFPQMPCVVTTTNMTSSPGVATTTMPGINATTNMASSPDVTMTTPVAESSSSKSSNIGLYAGAGAGAVVLVLLIGIVALLLKRTQERRRKYSVGELRNVHHRSESSGVGLLRLPESMRSTLSSPHNEQAPIPKKPTPKLPPPIYAVVKKEPTKPTPKLPPPDYAVVKKEPTATSPGDFAIPAFTDDVKPTPKLPPPIYAVVKKEPKAGSGGSSQDAGATNNTPPPGGFYNTLHHDKDRVAGSGGSSQAVGATNTTPPPGGFYNTLQHDKDREVGGLSGYEVYIYARVRKLCKQTLYLHRNDVPSPSFQTQHPLPTPHETVQPYH